MATRTIKHAKQDRADLDAKIQALRLEGRRLTGSGITRSAEQDARLMAIDAEMTTLTAQAAEVATEIVRFERLADEERASGTMNPGGGGVVRRPTGRKFAEMFPTVALDAGGFRSADEFLATLHSGLADQRLIPAYGLRATSTVGVPSEGGFAVPTQMFAAWLDASLESEIVRSRADVRPMTSDSAVAPGWDDLDHTSNLYGGFAGEWLAEAGDMTAQTPKLRLIQLTARKLGILARVSNELLADGMGFEQQLGIAITRSLGWFLDQAFLFANGAGKPIGIVNSACTVSVAKETNQAAATINYTNLANMFARMHPASIANSVWVCNSTAIPQLLQLAFPIGTAGSHVPVMSESGGEFRMLTRPVVFTEKVPALGTKGDIGLYDFSQYVVGLRSDFTLAKSQHVGFTSDTTYYRGIIRVDGMPKMPAPVTPDAGDTLSPFVVLDDRS